MAGWFRRTALIAVVAVPVLAGCTTSGEASMNAARVLGDLATIQPCSLIGLDVFAEFGAAEFGSPESLGYCTVVVKPEPSETVSFTRNVAEEVTIMVGGLLRPSEDPWDPPTDKLEDVADSIYTTQPDDSFASCWQTLVFAEDDLALSVRSRMSPTASPIPTCDMVEAGMARVVEVILAGEVEHRSPASNSLISLDPCDLVEGETVTALPGFAEAQRVDSPSRHQCDWHTSTGADAMLVKVTFGVARPPTFPETDYLGGNSDPIAGRPSVTIHTDRICTVATGHISFEDVAGATGFVETVEVDVAMPLDQSDLSGQVDDTDPAACEVALAVARALWPRLPSP